ncbi:MAG: hypothetical protein FH749_15255 [Firmicutes bacterium]|nr:hypothetical protein [Bacillota bacterium]
MEALYAISGVIVGFLLNVAKEKWFDKPILRFEEKKVTLWGAIEEGQYDLQITEANYSQIRYIAIRCSLDFYNIGKVATGIKNVELLINDTPYPTDATGSAQLNEQIVKWNHDGVPGFTLPPRTVLSVVNSFFVMKDVYEQLLASQENGSLQFKYRAHDVFGKHIDLVVNLPAPYQEENEKVVEQS